MYVCASLNNILIYFNRCSHSHVHIHNTHSLCVLGIKKKHIFFRMQIWDLHLNNPDCRGVEIGDDYVFIIKTNLTDCGTIMVSLTILSIYHLFFMTEEVSFLSRVFVLSTYVKA